MKIKPLILMLDEVAEIIFRNAKGIKVGMYERDKDDCPIKIGKALFKGPRSVEI